MILYLVFVLFEVCYCCIWILYKSRFFLLKLIWLLFMCDRKLVFVIVV